jgi:transposase
MRSQRAQWRAATSQNPPDSQIICVVIQFSKTMEVNMARFDLSDFEWSVIQPLLPQKSRGVPRVDDRRVLNGIFWRLRTGAPWADIPVRYGPYTTCVNRFNRWRRAGIWAMLLREVSKAYQGDIQMIDCSSIRVHQHAANHCLSGECEQSPRRGQKSHPIQ